MAFKINIAGIEVVCDSAEEAIALTQKLSGAKQQAQQPPAKKATVVQPAQPELPQFESFKAGGFDTEAATKAFLSTIRRANGSGVNGEALASVLGVKHAKGLGGRLALINKKVVADGFRPEDLYYVVRDSSTDHLRRWYAGPKLGMYLDALDLV